MMNKTDEQRLAEFGDQVRILRNRRKMTLLMAADKAGISIRHWSNIEHGRTNITLLIIDRISRALGVNPLRLMVCYWGDFLPEGKRQDCFEVKKEGVHWGGTNRV